jgi:DNA-directed RNA polymerase subunit beta'
VINTTVGRVIFNAALPAVMPFVNGLLKKKGLQQVVQYCHLHFGLEKTVEMLDGLKNLGFTYATRRACRSASTTWSSRRRRQRSSTRRATR